MRCFVYRQQPRRIKPPRNLPLPAQSSLWKVPAFCRPPSTVLDQAYLKDQCLNIQAACNLTPNELCTDDVWESTQLIDWAKAEKSSLILVQGSYESTHRLERFSVEICNFLSEKQPTISMLRAPTSSEYFASSDERELVRQLAIQALQTVSDNDTVFFVADMLQRFREASTSETWFSILEDIFQLFSGLFLVVNVSVLGGRGEKARTWPTNFQRLIMHLQTKTSTCLRVLLLATYPIWPESDTMPLISIRPKLGYPFEHDEISQIWDVLPERYLPIFLPEGTGNSLPSQLSVAQLSERNGQSTEEKYPGTEDQATGTEKEELGTNKELPGSEVKLPGCVSHETAIEMPDHDSIASEAAQQAHTFNAARTESDENRPEFTCPVSPPTGRRRIGIAIFCALTLEADAVEALFDKQWTDKCSRAERDTNTYSLGVIGRHNVVLVHMPGMGIRPAAAAAAYCRVSFPDVSLALVVGVCGGVPLAKNGTELLLGDVAISEGLVLYDFGRQFPHRFKRKDSVSDSARKLPAEILSFLAKLKSRKAHKRLQERTSIHLNILRQELGGLATYPGVAEDKLFESTYRHKHQDSFACASCATSDGTMGLVCDLARTATCEELKCDIGKLVVRKRQKDISQSTVGRTGDPQPFVHFVMFALGDRVMKSGEDRDRIARSEGIMAFEMEGAGVWEILPCFIIKGICDYADSHKSKRWQEYAAATAAACTRAFLEDWRE